MLNCQHTMMFQLAMLVIGLLAITPQSSAKPAAEPIADIMAEAVTTDLSKLSLITDDVIHDTVEKDTKRVIRVNPLDLPPIKEDPNILNMDSSLYKIQTIKPYSGKRNYIDMRRSRPQIDKKFSVDTTSDSPIIRGVPLNVVEKPLKPKHQPKKQNLHFLYNQKDLEGNLLSKIMRVHVAPGAYPVYYVISKANGRFGKFPLKTFNSPKAFTKYLMKNKLEQLPTLETNEGE